MGMWMWGCGGFSFAKMLFVLFCAHFTDTHGKKLDLEKPNLQKEGWAGKFGIGYSGRVLRWLGGNKKDQ